MDVYFRSARENRWMERKGGGTLCCAEVLLAAGKETARTHLNTVVVWEA